MPSIQKPLLVLALLLCLSGCGARPADAGQTSAPAAGPAESWQPGSLGRTDADERAAAAKDGLEGSYYNDYLRMLLRLDGCGGCTLSGGGVDAVGSYVRSGDTLTLDFGSRSETAQVDGDGDVTIAGYSGYYLRDWAFWGIGEEEVGAADLAGSAQRETLVLSDGTQRYRDFGNQIAFTCSGGMQVLPDRLDGAVAAADGAGGYVTGRNVTDALADFDGGAEEFLARYITTYTFADYSVFFGAITDCDPILSAAGEVPGRLAASSLRIRGPETAADVRVILYTSTYADGTENYICKTYLVPAGDAARLRELERAVTDMSAVRMREEG